jgi:uncharacterized cupin superfamily protein
VGRLEQVHLEPHPIDPAWVLAGTPHARWGNHSESVDGWAGTACWDCTAGRFRWHFAWEETVLILQGEVRVTDEFGATSVLGVGDVARFPVGSWFTWEVERYVRKLAFCRLPAAAPAGVVARVRRRLAALRGRIAAAGAGVGARAGAGVGAGAARR